MASFQKTQDIDILSVRKLYIKGDNNSTLPINYIPLTDGLGGVNWTSVTAVNQGVSFNTLVTTASTFTSGVSTTTFSLLDGPNAGIKTGISGIGGSLYAKAFGQIDVDGVSSIYSYNTTTGNINSNLRFTGSGILNISTNTNLNQIQFFVPNDAISSLSTSLTNITALNSTLVGATNSFNSPFSSIIYNAISSFSTSIGPILTIPRLNTEISSFSTALGPVINPTYLNSTLSTFSTALGPVLTRTNINSSLYTGTLNTSTIYQIGFRQPFIQYGSNILPSGVQSILLPQNYINSNYAIQLSYGNALPSYTKPLNAYNITENGFNVSGDINGNFYWTTYGNTF
jgi:hypothetical protein